MTFGRIISLIVGNALVWLGIHLAVPYLFTRLPARIFRPGGIIFRRRWWEGNGGIYERLFMVKHWKDRLPDGAAIFRGGFRKKELQGRESTYLARFLVETCRGEAAHWAVMAAAPFFFLWNPPWAGLFMIVYAVAINLPCIIAQRYNRLRLARVLLRRKSGVGTRPRLKNS